MKRICWMLVLAAVLSGCAGKNQELSAAMALREALLSGNGCSFRAKVTADYGEGIQTFTMDCQADAGGKVCFSIAEPASIAGIRGDLSDDGGNITFDDKALYFPLLTDALLSPVSAPWIFLKTLRSGYLTSACTEAEQIHLTVDDSYADDALKLDIWLEGKSPVRGDILQNGRRILSLEVEDFTLL